LRQWAVIAREISALIMSAEVHPTVAWLIWFWRDVGLLHICGKGNASKRNSSQRRVEEKEEEGLNKCVNMAVMVL